MSSRNKYQMVYVRRRNGDVIEDSAGFFRAFFSDDVAEAFTAHRVDGRFFDKKTINTGNTPDGSTSVFSTELPDLQGFINSLDMLDENVRKAAVKGLNKGADIIVNAQKRRISAKSQRLANAITKGTIYTTKKGSVGISTGYHAGAFKKDKDGFSPGMVGMVFEFGRPGQKGDTMKQKRNGETVTVKIGAVQPVPHIRAGFDETVNAASQTVIDTVSAEIGKLGE